MEGPMHTWERNNSSYFTEENFDEILQYQILMGVNLCTQQRSLEKILENSE